jgi:hypothetical protein
MLSRNYLHQLQNKPEMTVFPLNLVLVNEEDVPIGHSRLSLVIGKENSCFLESGTLIKNYHTKFKMVQ